MVLVGLVVVGHSWTLVTTTDTNRWLYDYLYFWHIPAFVLLTGYLSRSFEWDRRHLVALVTTLLVPYVIFEAALYYFREALGDDPQEGVLWLVPHWSMWYLPVLIMWRLATPVLRLHWAVIPLSVAVSLVGGLWSGELFCVSRALGLLPFFVIGLQLSREHLGLLQGRRLRVVAACSMVGILLLARGTDEWARTAFLYYDAAYTDLGWAPLPAMEVRLWVILVGVVGAFSALSLIPHPPGWFAGLGSASLVVYLWHGFPIRFAEYAGWQDWAAVRPTAGLVVTTVAAIALALLLASPPARRWLGFAVDPVGRLRRRTPSDAGSAERRPVVPGDRAPAGPAPDAGGPVPVVVGHQVAHPAQREGHQPVRPHADGPERG
jgi:fucose 4-O-acetylase-like acetyltransferase